MNRKLRVAIVDDHPLFRAGVARSLEETGDFEILGEGSTADDAKRLAQDLRPDILLLDVSLPGGGLNVVQPIIAENPSQKIVMLTVSESNEDISKALTSGAYGYILKGIGSRSLVEILKRVSEGEQYLSPVLSARLLSGIGKQSDEARSGIQHLTRRESEILELVGLGLSNKVIAGRLELEEKTIKHHMTRILSKLGVTNRTEAALMLRDTRDAQQ
ncbi:MULTISPECIES: response regulator [Mesorhizobium]|uniref:DNA-binding response regulator n=1 Tax=Mesorhizobium denitrificans TaxID=2294114 RepID=A0A371XFA1_9HYPH|nr:MULTISPECIES: response regulator transcription factor [Mesorhizobium]RFC67901.1 DNA-binding response regulator [Mesorhizobium denitrificans]